MGKMSLVVRLLGQGESLATKLGNSGPIDRDVVRLEAFGIRYRWDVWAREMPTRGGSMSATSPIDVLGKTVCSLIVPEAIVNHTQRTSRVLVVVREAAGVEELDHGRPRRGSHPQQRSKTVSVDTHHDLLFAISCEREHTQKPALTVVRPARRNCSIRESLSISTMFTSYP